jgi:hypothetical protein
MWEFYLSAAQLDFMHGPMMVFHLLLSTKRDAVPITRDFMLDTERAALAGMLDDIGGPRKSKDHRGPTEPHAAADGAALGPGAVRTLES